VVDMSSHLGNFAKFTASSLHKLEAGSKIYTHPLTAYASSRSPTPVRGRSRSVSPQRSRSASPTPGLGFGVSESQRPDLSKDWLRHHTQSAFYNWEQSFEKSSTVTRSPTSGWAQEKTSRTLPEQWCRDFLLGAVARVDGRKRPSGKAAASRMNAYASRSQSPQARSPSAGSLLDRSPSFHTLLKPKGRVERSASPQGAGRSPKPRAVPKPIFLGESRSMEDWRTHWERQIGGSADFSVAHPDWGASSSKGISFGKSSRKAVEPVGGTSFGKSRRKVVEPIPKRSGRSSSPQRSSSQKLQK